HHGNHARQPGCATGLLTRKRNPTAHRRARPRPQTQRLRAHSNLRAGPDAGNPGPARLAHEGGKLKRQPIYIGGLGRVFTEIYDLEAHRAHRNHSNLKLTEALNLIVLEPGQLEKMRLSGGRIFVLTAGMMSEHTAAHDLAARMIGDERQAIFFVGYADPDTPGGRLKAAKPGETFVFSPSAGEVTRRCEVLDFDLTAHANRDELLGFVAQVSPRAVLLGHGEADARNWFEEQIR